MDLEYLKKSLIRVFVAIAASVCLLLFNGMGWIVPVYSAANYVLEPVQYWMAGSARGAGDFILMIMEIGKLRSENAELVIENVQLNAEVSKLRELQREDEVLRSQLGIEITKGWELVEVRILGIDQYGIAEHVVIDGGTDNGISAGDPVILGDVLVGEVRDVYRSTARVRLVSNQKSNIVAIDQQTRAKGLVHGSLQGIVMEGVLESEPLNEGDSVITWEDDIPGGLVIGTISKVEDVPTSSTKRAYIETGFSLEDVQYVFVIIEP